ncbi:hypothetical protein SCHPADRAFT_944291 [Schizopora paradoxa]|uniref:Nudix hydrolase domain-containing protein n=1 Tax=Schizopora paradoxa TaxID=27342 RepID=A0A0H2R9W4_9AGAM|nr:hypothetical protein SCHPADRAFT_944291 [Schizopora paradoxa]
MSTRRKSTGLLNFHRPGTWKSDDEQKLTEETRRCLRNLASYRAPKELRRKAPRTRSAAVLVGLFVGRQGDLYVLLNQRSHTLRSYAGDTSLPGGKVEEKDRSIEDTARREAFEEIGLPLDKRKVPLLCILEPFLIGNASVVTPVVVLILDPTLRPVLNGAEVESLFSHPLKGFLDTEAPFPHEPHLNEVPYYSYNDISWMPAGRRIPIRMHRFLTGREAGGIKPVYGGTAAMMIRVASIAFRRSPDFDVIAPGQPTMIDRIDYVLHNDPKFLKAKEDEESERRSSKRHRHRIRGKL